MKMRFVNVVPFFPDRISYMVDEAQRLESFAGLDSPAYCMTLHPESVEPFSKPYYYAEKFAELQALLKKTPVKPGILIQSLMGHGWAGQAICGKPWQYTINITGKTAYRMCPLDPGFQEYVYETMRILSELRPAFFLMDDDIRLINNGPNGLECFCPLHLEAFNFAAGTSFSADKMRKYMQNAPCGDRLAGIFDQIRRDSLLKLASLVRAAINETDPAISCGYCAGGREFMLMEELEKTFAGTTEPFMRIHNAMYLEEKTLDFSKRMYHTNLMRKAAGSIKVLLDEADTCPHNRFSKSAIGMHSHIVGGVLNGLSGAKLWLTNLMEPEPEESVEYEKIIARHRNFYDALLNLCDGIDWLGPRTILPKKELQWRPAGKSSYYEWNDWQWQYLNRFGIPGSYGDFDQDRVTLLCGEQARSMSPKELGNILSGKVLLDGSAVFAVHEKGLSDLIGCVPHCKEFRFSCEKTFAPERSIRFLNDFSAPFLEVNGGKVLTKLMFSEYVESPTSEFIAPGSVYFENHLGGKVVSAVVAMENIIYNMLSPARKQWLVRMLELLDGRKLPVYLKNNADTYLRCGRTRTKELIVAIVNLSFDSLENPVLVCSTKVKKVFRLGDDGKWQQIEFCQESDKRIVLMLSLATYENLILKIS